MEDTITQADIDVLTKISKVLEDRLNNTTELIKDPNADILVIAKNFEFNNPDLNFK